MCFPRRPKQGTELPDRLINSPLLRVMVFDPWFRTALLCLVAILVFLALVLPKIWRVTPRGFLPVVKISGLDMAQAWSLKRSALRSMAAGDFDRAAYAWQAAVANNPADAELVRGALRNILQPDRCNPKHQGMAVGQARWLLRLTGTNAADLDLVSRVYNKFELYGLTLSLLGPRERRLTLAEADAYLKALFHSGEVRRFAARWQDLSENPAAIPPDLQLYHAAYLAGWDPSSDALAGRKQLEAALDNPGTRVLANRLRLAVSLQLADAEGYDESLQRLAQWQADTLPEHLAYWQLLATLGRKAEAAKLARSFPRPPASASEARRLAESYLVLGLRDEARQLLREAVQLFGNSPEPWVLQANLLVEERKWEELRELALQLRMHPAVGDVLATYSFFLEGRAELGLERRPLADTAFKKLTQRPFDDHALGLSTAIQVLQLGYPGVARDILLPLEPGLAGQPKYWQILFAAAYELKRSDWLLAAAARAYLLQPENMATANNYAAALLLNRERSEEAIKLTLQLLDRFPQSMAAKINHGLALLLNRRTLEAEALLKAIDPAKLNGVEAASLYLGLFEVCFNEQRYDQARLLCDRINKKSLFPNQIKWLDESCRQIAERQAAQ